MSLTENEDIECAANDIVKVYLDTAELIYPESLPPLPEKYHKRLIKRLEVFAFLHDDCQQKLIDCDSAFEIKPYDLDKTEKEIDTYEIRNAFLSFTLSIMKHYDKYFTPPKARKEDFLELKDLFNIPEFLIANKANKEGTFLSKLVETGLFTYFIETRVINNKYEDEYKFIDQCVKKLKSKKDYKFITSIKPEKTLKTYLPNDEGIKKGQLFYYHRFPKLNDSYYVFPRMPETVLERESSTKDPTLAVEDLTLMDPLKWAKFLLEMMYTLWFVVLSLKLKKDFSDHYTKLTEYAHIVFENLKSKGIKPNQTIYKNLIEACSFCGMNDRALEIVTKLKDSKTEISPFAHGVYLEAISRARQFKYERAKKKPIEEAKEENSREDDQIKIENCIIFLLSTPCKHCSETLYAEDVISGWKKSYNEYITQCPFCSQNFTPEIKVIQQRGNFQFETEFYMLNPLIIKKELDNLLEAKGENLHFLDRFELDHKHIFWNIYLYSSILKLPTFFLENHLNSEQIYDHVKELDREIHAYTFQKNTKASSLFLNSLLVGKINSAPKKSGTDSILSDGVKPDKHSEGEVSLQRSHSSIMVNMNKAKETNADPSIKKVFGDLLDDLRETLERKLVDYELDMRLRKTEDSNLDLAKENDNNESEKQVEQNELETIK